MTASDVLAAVMSVTDHDTREFMDSVTKEARSVAAATHDVPEPVGEERMPVVEPDHVIDTVAETWAMSDAAWYKTASEFVAAKLVNGKGKWCLVIGSPIPEAKKLWNQNWYILYVDIRKPDDFGFPCEYRRNDATNMKSIGDSTMDAVSSTCVVCHAGLGRYGDPIKSNGDVAVMREIFRVLKPGGLATVCFGPCLSLLNTSIVYGNVHRIYKPDEAIEMAYDVGFELIVSQMASLGPEPVGAPEVEEAIGCDAVVRYCYLSALLRKPE